MIGSIKLLVETTIPTRWGHAIIMAFGQNEEVINPYIILKFGKRLQSPTYVRIHSECFTGDVLGSKKCECGDQLDTAGDILSKEGGVLIYAREEGRGIGLVNKLKAYALQNKGFNTAEANTELGFPEDLRDYKVSVEILKFLQIERVKLITNNPLKISGLESQGIQVDERIPIEISSSEHNYNYLKTKKDHFGHYIDLH